MGYRILGSGSTRQSTDWGLPGRSSIRVAPSPVGKTHSLTGSNFVDTSRILQLAAKRLAESKVAFAEQAAIAPAPVDPNAPMPGQPPVDPAMAMGGAPMPVDPATGQPMPMDPAMMGGAPPMDPAMAGAPMDPAMAGGMPPAEPMPAEAPMPEEAAGPDPVTKLLEDIEGMKQSLAQIKDVVGQLADALPGAVSAAQLMKAQEDSPLNPSSGETKKSNDEEFAVPEGFAVADSDGGSAAVSQEAIEFLNQPNAEISKQAGEVLDQVASPSAHFNAAANAAARAFRR